MAIMTTRTASRHSTRLGRVVTILGAGAATWSRDLDNETTPRAIALRIQRRVANRVLACELVGDLSVDVRQVINLHRKEGAPTCLPRQCPQHELRVAKTLRPQVGAAQRDSVDGRL